MAQFSEGDLVVLKSGSMRMIVEAIEGEKVHCLWCNEGQIGRDTFPAFALNKWEVREDAPRAGTGRPYGGDRDGGARPYKPRSRSDDEGAPRPYKPRGRKGDDAPDRNAGWDGKPREKKFYRKDD